MNQHQRTAYEYNKKYNKKYSEGLSEAIIKQTKWATEYQCEWKQPVSTANNNKGSHSGQGFAGGTPEVSFAERG